MSERWEVSKRLSPPLNAPAATLMSPIDIFLADTLPPSRRYHAKRDNIRGLLA